MYNKRIEKGLSEAEVFKQSRQFGKNVITTKKTYSPLSIFLSQFPTFINAILLLAATLAFFVHDTIDGYFILAIVLLNGLFGFFQEYRAEKSLEKLKTYTTSTSRVIRDGVEQQIPTEQLVPGDVVIITEGDRVPADGTLLKTHYIEIDESILTGESLPIMKENESSVFLGTLIAKGKARIRVTEIGMQTKFGQIAHSLATIKTEKTPLQKQLNVVDPRAYARGTIMLS